MYQTFPKQLCIIVSLNFRYLFSLSHFFNFIREKNGHQVQTFFSPAS